MDTTTLIVCLCTHGPKTSTRQLSKTVSCNLVDELQLQRLPQFSSTPPEELARRARLGHRHRVPEQLGNFYGLLKAKTMGNGLSATTRMLMTSLISCNCGQSAVCSALYQNSCRCTQQACERPCSHRETRQISQRAATTGARLSPARRHLRICTSTQQGHRPPENEQHEGESQWSA